jgi:hypothetical protein
MQAICPICNSDFIAEVNPYGHLPQKYCTMKCKNEAKRLREKIRPHKSKAMVHNPEIVELIKKATEQGKKPSLIASVLDKHGVLQPNGNPYTVRMINVIAGR